MYPSPCQCRCIYCEVDRKWDDSDIVKKAYEKIFKILDLANQRGLIADDALWQIACGEITIHPYKNRIFKLIEGKRSIFYTNGFIYDEKIASNLRNNKKSMINISVDSGTAKTWKRVKGVDNYKEVYANLKKYYAASARPGQITLKYIIMPGINDSLDDYYGVMEMINQLKPPRLSISRNTLTTYSISERDRNVLLESASRLVRLCNENDVPVGMFQYSQAERDLIHKLANN